MSWLQQRLDALTPERDRLWTALYYAAMLAAVTLIVASFLVGCSTGPTEGILSGAAAARSEAGPQAPTDARALLDTLPVKGRAPKTGYSRKQFGPAWADVDHNGCDTRNDILARDLTDETLQTGLCVVATGTLADPYTGDEISFTRGPESTRVQIDHVVALSDAWQTGAQALPEDQRVALANDPLNLQATDGPTNEAKGDGDAASWLPPNRAAWCAYAALQTQVKAKYKLWVTPAERDMLARVLDGCAPEPLSDRGGITTG